MVRNSCENEDGSPCHCAAERILRKKAVIDSSYLFEERDEVQIQHAGEIYRLRLTKNGKLILNK